MRERVVLCYVFCSYRKRFWRESVFEGVDLVRAALDESYGPGQVNLVSAAFRWLNHHSQMSPDCGGQSTVPVTYTHIRGISFPSFRCHNYWGWSDGTSDGQLGCL